MDTPEIKHKCQCGLTMHIPFLPELKAQAMEEYDLAQQTARQEFRELWLWLHSASLLELLKFWFRRNNV